MSREDAESAVVLLHQAAVWHRDGEMVRAEDACREALALDPGNPDAMSLLAMIVHGRGESDMAATLLRRAVRIAPTGRLWSNLGVVLSSNRDYVGGVSAYRQAVAADPLNVTSWTNLLYSIDHHPYATPARRLADRRAFDAMHCVALTAAAPPHENDRDPERRLRIGYVSADFRNHSASMGFGPVILEHDRERFEVVCYDNYDGPPNQDTLRFQEAADAWRPIADRADDDVARQIRADAIDILVDLSGYSFGHRLMVFARKPAPIQVTGWGHATGTGLGCMDYLASDATTIPPEHEDHHTERILRLPSAVGFDARPPWPEVAAPPAERNGYLTFGYLGRGYKLNEQTVAAWAEILGRLPTSRLILKADEYGAATFREWVLAAFSALGVGPERISIRGTTSRAIHLATYNELDVALDPFPHGGGITTLDACLMGVPTVTLLGDYPPGRLSASVLRELGSGQVAGTVAEYIEAAEWLAKPRLSSLFQRQWLRDALLTSVICDQRAYAAAVEASYRQVWREWCER